MVYIFVNRKQSNAERRYKYRELRKKGCSPCLARILRDYRYTILKRMYQIDMKSFKESQK